MKADILTRNDIQFLVDEFYNEVRNTPLLGNIFDETMHVDWDKHLPKMYDFWENVLFQTGSYKGFPFAAHLAVNDKEQLTSEHFEVWLQLFHATIDKLFQGQNAEELKAKSAAIQGVWSHKMEYMNKNT
jgi:hemoglobin